MKLLGILRSPISRPLRAHAPLFSKYNCIPTLLDPAKHLVCCKPSRAFIATCTPSVNKPENGNIFDTSIFHKIIIKSRDEHCDSGWLLIITIIIIIVIIIMTHKRPQKFIATKNQNHHWMNAVIWRMREA
jgi:hypothetical protein